MNRVLTATAAVLLLAGLTASQDKKPDPAAAKDQVGVPFYGNEKCPVSGDDVERSLYVETEKGRIYYCCDHCKAKIEADKEGAYKKAYPAETPAGNKDCPVMKKPVKEGVAAVYQGHMIGFCCKNCVKKLAKAPLRTLAIAMDEKLADVKNATCPVSGKPAEGDDFVTYKGKVVRLCCPKCAGAFAKDADALLKKAEDSEKAK
jgi:hypothetical protein